MIGLARMSLQQAASTSTAPLASLHAGSELANRTMIGAFAARPATLRRAGGRPLTPQRLPKHVRYRCATAALHADGIRAWIGYTARLASDGAGPSALKPHDDRGFAPDPAWAPTG